MAEVKLIDFIAATGTINNLSEHFKFYIYDPYAKTYHQEFSGSFDGNFDFIMSYRDYVVINVEATDKGKMEITVQEPK